MSSQFREDTGIPLWAAASLGMGDVVRDLVDRGGSIKGSEALYAAASTGELAVVKILLSLGADPGECGGKYRTPLGAASAEGSSRDGATTYKVQSER